MQGQTPLAESVTSLNAFDIKNVQNFPYSVGFNFELKKAIVLRTSVRFNKKKFQQDFNFENLEGEKYFNTENVEMRNIKINSFDFSLGIGYKYQYGRNVIIPYLDIRHSFTFNAESTDFGLKEIGTNNFRITGTDLKLNGASFTYEIGGDYMVHFKQNGGMFGSLGFIYSKIPYASTIELRDNLYEDRVIENNFKLQESGFIIAAGIFFGFGDY